MVLEEEIFNSFHIWRVWWSGNNLFLTVSTFGWCGGCGGLESDF